MLHLTTEQLHAAQQGEAVAIEANGQAFVLLSRAAYEDDLDFSPWSQQEMDLLANEAMQLVTDDGLNEDDA